MKKLNPFNALAALAVAVSIVVAAGPASAAAAHKPGERAHLRKAHEPESARLVDGLLSIKGTRAGEKIALRLQAGQPGILEVDFGSDDVADFSFPRADVARIALDARGGDDSVVIDERNGIFTDTIPTTLGGGGGDDRLAGGTGAETLRGGGGSDSIDGNRGDDIAVMGGGDDTFVWDPGDGSDTIEGQGGTDTMLFNGANAAEQVDLSANGKRLRFFRNVATITMDTDGVERVDFNALGGADLVTVNDLSATDVRAVNVDLAASGGGDDAQDDRIVVKGTDRNDAIRIAGDAQSVTVSGLAATVTALHPQPNDRLDLETLGGRDSVDSAGLAARVIQLFVDSVLVP